MKTFFVSVVAGICLVWFLWAVFAWGSTSQNFDSTISVQDVRNRLAQRGLKTCSERSFTLDKTPGFVAGKTLSLSKNCTLDTNPLTVSFLEFENEEARSAAQQRVASVHRGGYGPHFAYSYGPYVVTIQGTRGIGDQLLLGKLLSQARVQP